MKKNLNNNPWCCIGKSVRGAIHKRIGLGNQDYLSIPEDNEDYPLVVSVADGHGAPDYFRSDKGAKFAVEAAKEVCKQFFIENSTDTILDKRFKEIIPREIVHLWRYKVHDHIKYLHPYSDEEENLLEKKVNSETILVSNKKRPVASIDYSLIPYGTTLITVVISHRFIVFLQLGDGDILCINQDGTIARPILKDEQLIGNYTTSLCTAEAWSDMRMKIISLNELLSVPILIMISTDGYANSFPNDTEFEKELPHMLDLICHHQDGIVDGIRNIENNLENRLDEVSKDGSGDDISVVLIGNIENLNKYRLKNENEIINKKSTFLELDSEKDVPHINQIITHNSFNSPHQSELNVNIEQKRPNNSI
jgi:hypothetical protein